MKAWAWILILIIILGLGVSGYFLFGLSKPNTEFLQKNSNVAAFYLDLQQEIDIAWKSQNYEFQFEVNLPSEINGICFVDFSSAITQQSDYSQVQNYKSFMANLVLLPTEKTDTPYVILQHINIQETTKNKNPYCVLTSKSLTIKKGFYEALVTIE